MLSKFRRPRLLSLPENVTSYSLSSTYDQPQDNFCVSTMGVHGRRKASPSAQRDHTAVESGHQLDVEMHFIVIST